MNAIGQDTINLIMTACTEAEKNWQALVVANHANGFVDPVIVASVLRRLPRFLAKAALWKVAIARPFLALAGVLPVYRSGDGDRPSDNASVFAACHEELAQGATVAIFPEGTRTRNGEVGEFRGGALLAARRARAPVVHAGIRGAFVAWPRGRRLPRPRRIELALGAAGGRRARVRRGDRAGQAVRADDRARRVP